MVAIQYQTLNAFTSSAAVGELLNLVQQSSLLIRGFSFRGSSYPRPLESENTRFPQPSTSGTPDIQLLTLSGLHDLASPRAADARPDGRPESQQQPDAAPPSAHVAHLTVSCHAGISSWHPKKDTEILRERER